MCRGIGSGGRGDGLDADDRPYRETTAAASDQNGRGVDHGRGYKATPDFRQGDRREIESVERLGATALTRRGLQGPGKGSLGIWLLARVTPYLHTRPDCIP